MLDPAFVPASLWNRAYRTRVAETGGRPLAIVLERSDGVTTGTNARLAALRWPERTLVFDDGHTQATEGFLVACEPRG